MAISLSASFQRVLDRTSITVTDTTGTYDLTTNPTGYGGVNPAVGDFSNFVVTVTPPNPSTYAPTGTPVAINAYPSLPSDSDGTFTITSLALLGSANTVIPDGVYRFDISATYSGGAGEGTATFTGYAIFYEITECCIQSLTMSQSDCDCQGDVIEKLNLANLWLTSFQPTTFNGTAQDAPLVACGEWNKAAELLVSLNEVCTDDGCNGCG